MTPRAGLMLAVVLAASPVLSAQDMNVLIRESLQVEQKQWQHLDLNMSPDDYQNVSRHNQRLARDRVRDTLLSLGIPDAGISVVGAAVSLTVSKTKIPLNSSDTLALELKDLIDEDRRFLLRYKVDW